MSNQPARTSWWRVALCGALVAAGCTTVDNPVSCADGFCHDPSLPFCDVDGSLGGQRLTCIAVSCTPHELEACRGDDAIVCNATGDDYDVTHCEAGCSAETGGCKPTQIIPRYLPAVCNQLATEPALMISESMTLDTEDDGICNGGVVEQSSQGLQIGPPICVLHYGTIQIARNKTLKLTGRYAVALVADGPFVIDGILDVSADGIDNGPGGGSWSNGTTNNAIWPAAPGGAGFHTPGGPGGTATLDGGAFNGGTSRNLDLVVPFIGGTRAPSIGWIDYGGGGGGAATLISCKTPCQSRGSSMPVAVAAAVASGQEHPGPCPMEEVPGAMSCFRA